MNVSKFHSGSHESWRRRSQHAFQYGCVWLILVVVLSGLSAQEAENAAPAGPRLEFEAKEIDLGDLDRGQVVTARFTARNVSDQPVRIQRVKPG
jgi:hypothetical protein